MIVTETTASSQVSHSNQRPSRMEILAAWVLRGPLSAAIVALCIVQLVTWLPHYMTWPWFADHDVFATAAQAWNEGSLPYRDTFGNNFPGTIYLLWILGKLFGWGYTPALYAADAALLACLGAIMLAWSLRCFGGFLPGAVGYLTFLAYYLSLDYSQAAQRDWQGPFFAVSALMIVEAWPSRSGRLGSALNMALAVTVRPQTVLFLPGLVMALDEGVRKPDESWSKTALATAGWALLFVVSLVMTFAPLLTAGVFTDFVHGVSLTAYGAHYNKANLGTFVKEMLIQVAPFRLGAVLVSIVLLANRATPRVRRVVCTWLVAIGGVFLYKPISPLPHAYLTHPLMLLWSISVALLVQLSGEIVAQFFSLRFAIVLLIVALGATGRPRFCNPRASLAALDTLRSGVDPEVRPLGYTHNDDVPKSAAYSWDDYRRLLVYLRTETSPLTRVANVLKGVPAVTGPTARLSAFPAESIAWLYMVNHDDEARFAGALENSTDSVVVWTPSEEHVEPNFTLDVLRPVIVRNYEPAARFGVIEVWRRKASAPAAQRPGPAGAMSEPSRAQRPISY